MCIWPKADAARRHFQSRSLPVCEPNVAAAVSKLVLEYYGVNRPLVVEVDPVVWAVERTIDHVLWICKREACEDFFSDVSLATTGCVLEKPHVGSCGYEDTALPAHDAVRHDDLISKHRATIGNSIAVRVLEQRDAPYGPGVQGIACILGDVDAPIFVPIHRDWAADQRLRGKRLNTKPLINSNCPESFSLAVGRTRLAAKSPKKTAHEDANYQQRNSTDKPSASAG